MNEEEIQRFIGQLRLSTEELDEFNRSLRSLNPVLSKIVDPLNQFNKATSEATETTKRKAKSDAEGAEAQRQNTAATTQNKHVTEALTDAQEELEESTTALKSAMGSAIKGVANSAVAFGDALLKNEEGVTKYGTAVGKAGDAALEIGSKFGILGTIIGGLIKAGTAVMEAQFKQSDMQRKAITDLSKLGAAGEFTSKEIIKLAHSADIPIERFNELAGPLKSMGTGIIALGDSAGDSTREFAKLVNVGADVRKGFFRLGVSFPELTQNMADYVAMQKMSGRVITQQAKDSGELQKAALKYSLTLQELSDLTGLSVEESKKQLAATTNTIQMTIINAQRAEELNILEERKKTATGTELQQIEKAIALHKAQEAALENANKAMAAIGGGGKEAGAAIQQFLVKGSLSPEAARKFSQLGIDLDKYRQQYLKGEFDTSAFMQEYQKKIRERVKTSGDGVIQSGEDAERMAKELGISQEEVVWAMGNMGKDFDKASKDVAQKQADALSGQGKMAEDAMTENLANLSESERQAQKLKEQALDATNVLYNKVVPEMTDSVNALKKLFDALAVSVGALLAVTGIGGIVKGAQAAAKGFSAAKDWLTKFKTPPAGTPPAGTPPAAPSATPPAGTSPASTSTILGKDGKPLKGAALKAAQAKAARIQATIAAAPAASAVQTSAGTAATAAGKTTGMLGKAGSVLSKAGSALGKFGKFIPGVGTVLTAGLAAKGAYDAFQDTEGTLGLEKGAKATTGQKVAAGAAGALSSLSFGLLDQKSIGGFLNKSLGLGETEKEKEERIKLEEELVETEKRKKEVLNSLINDLRDTANPLSKFSKNLGETKDPIKEFNSNLETINKTLSSTTGVAGPTAGGGIMSSIASALGFGGGGSAGGGSAVGGSAVGGSAGGGGGLSLRKSDIAAGGGLAGIVARLLGGGASGEQGPAPDAVEGKVGGGGGPEIQTVDDNAGAAKGKRKDTEGLVVHHTGGRGLQTAIDTLKARGLGYHYLIDRDGSVTNYVPDDQKAFHAGKTDKHPEIKNSNSIGVALVAKDDKDITKQQLASGFNLGQQLMAKYGIGSVYGHGETSSHKNSEEGKTLAGALRTGRLPESAPKAEKGGILSGPKSGFPATLHGNEIVVPLDPNSILAELGKKSAQQAASEINNVLPETKTNQMDGMKDILNLNQALMELLTNKLDTMINKMDTSNDTQSKLLKVSQV